MNTSPLSLPVGEPFVSDIERYVTLLTRWQCYTQLISTASEAELWQRHVLDAAQLEALIPASADGLWDVGSGAGLPGMILAILRRDMRITLIEKQHKRAVFLERVVEQLGLRHVTVHAGAVEALPSPAAEVVTARAVAPLPRLLHMLSAKLKPDTLCIFPLGQNFDTELTEAVKRYRFTWNLHASHVDPHSRILVLTEFHDPHATQAR